MFLRRRIGSRYLQLPATAALLLIPGWGLLWPQFDLRPLIGFLCAYIAACAVVRATSLRRRFLGAESHSRYNGWPAILSVPPFRAAREETAKGLLEPLFVLAAGIAIARANVPLGSFLCVAALGLLAVNGFLNAYQNRRAMDIRDSLHDQRTLADRVRRGRF